MRKFSIPLAVVISLMFIVALSFTVFAWSKSAENQFNEETEEANPYRVTVIPGDIFSVQYAPGSFLP